MKTAHLALVGLLMALSAPLLAGATPAAICEDEPAPGGHSCKQLAAWGKCSEAWIRQGGWCAATCGRCSQGSALAKAERTPDTVLTDAAPAANATASSLPDNTAEYGKVLRLSWLFYYAQRSGKLSSGRNPIPWRGDSHLEDRVPGGFHDAGDHLKLNFPLATSLSFLAWGVLEFPAAYAATAQTEAALDNLRWGADYLMACHVGDNQYIAQIGEPGADHSYWGRPEEQTGARPAYVWDASKPASDAAGAAASALAAASLVFRSSDAEYADACLDHARRLFEFASQFEGKYSASLPGPTSVYPSYNFEDDLAFAAAWLYRATKEAAYLDAARGYLKRWAPNPYVSWDSVGMPAHLLLLSLGAEAAGGVDHAAAFSQFLDAWHQGQSGIKFTRQGLAVAPLGGWGTLRHSANAALLMAIHAKHTDAADVRAACLALAQKQIDYMLGLRGSDRSYVVGYGSNPPTRAHHRGASCPDRPGRCDYQTAFLSPSSNPQTLAGALVGGPADTDTSYTDVRSDYRANEVAVDYNAGFTGALAGLVQLLGSPAPSAVAAAASE